LVRLKRFDVQAILTERLLVEPVRPRLIEMVILYGALGQSDLFEGDHHAEVLEQRLDPESQARVASGVGQQPLRTLRRRQCLTLLLLPQQTLRLLDGLLHRLLGLCLSGSPVTRHPADPAAQNHDEQENQASNRESDFVAAGEFAELVPHRRWASPDWLVVQMPL